MQITWRAFIGEKQNPNNWKYKSFEIFEKIGFGLKQNSKNSKPKSTWKSYLTKSGRQLNCKT